MYDISICPSESIIVVRPLWNISDQYRIYLFCVVHISSVGYIHFVDNLISCNIYMYLCIHQIHIQIEGSIPSMFELNFFRIKYKNVSYVVGAHNVRIVLLYLGLRFNNSLIASYKNGILYEISLCFPSLNCPDIDVSRLYGPCDVQCSDDLHLLSYVLGWHW